MVSNPFGGDKKWTKENVASKCPPDKQTENERNCLVTLQDENGSRRDWWQWRKTKNGNWVRTKHPDLPVKELEEVEDVVKPQFVD